MTFSETDSPPGSVDLNEIEQQFEKRVAAFVAGRVEKKVSCMLWTIMMFILMWSVLMAFLICVLYTHKLHVPVVVNTTITMVANCSGNVTHEYITVHEHNVRLKDEINKVGYGIAAGFFSAAAAAVAAAAGVTATP